MAFEPKNFHGRPLRDQAYPAEIAAQRPIMSPRIHCVEQEKTDDPILTRIRQEASERDENNRGSLKDNRCSEFNEALRAGHAWRNSGDE